MHGFYNFICNNAKNYPQQVKRSSHSINQFSFNMNNYLLQKGFKINYTFLFLYILFNM